jgi:hypothetical protein
VADICRLPRRARWVAAAALLGAVQAPPPVTATELGILVPLYSHPCWYDPPNYVWPQVAWAGRQVPVIAIINPNNGPGSGFPNSDYVRGLADLTSGAVVVVGYVYTSYGERPAAQVLADAAKYTNSPAVRGIFLDEVDSTTNHLAYYAAIASAIRALPRMSLVILNPGLPIAEEYVRDGVGDIVVMFEDREGWREHTPAATMRRHPARRFAMLWLGCPSEEHMRTGMDWAADRNFGWVYVTDDDLPNPWDSLPPWWSNLVERVRAYNEFRTLSIQGGADGVRLRCSAVPGRPTRVEYSSAPTTGWTPTGAAVTPTSTWFETAVGLPPEPAGWYRLFLLPIPTD